MNNMINKNPDADSDIELGRCKTSEKKEVSKYVYQSNLDHSIPVCWEETINSAYQIRRVRRIRDLRRNIRKKS